MQAPSPVLFVIHSLGHGGTERQVSVLASGLDRQKFQPHVATVEGGFRADELRRQGVPVISIPIRSFWNPGPWRLSDFLARYIRDNGIRLVHGFDPGLSLVTFLAARRSGIRMLSSQRFYMDLLTPRYRYTLLAIHWAADAIVANCQAVRNYLAHVYHYPLNRIEVCYNGIDTEAFSPEGRRRLPELADATVVIGSVCVFRPEKNLEQLVRAFARVHSKNPGARLVLMGSGPEDGKLRNLAEQLGVEQMCHFLSSDADVSGVMRSIDIYVSTSLSEGLPNSVMEAMACGCCVIATRVGGCPELMEHGIHGFLVPAGDLDALARQMENIAGQPDVWASVGAAAALRIRERFSISASTSKMGQIYELFCSEAT